MLYHDAFSHLKNFLATTHVLVRLGLSECFIVETNGSVVSVGALIHQDFGIMGIVKYILMKLVLYSQ